MKEEENLEKIFNETVDGFADLFEDSLSIEFDDLNLSSSPYDKYTVVGKIDEGGMKQILEIEDSDTTRTLAMAVIKDGKVNSRSAQRFIYEARITALLQHPNIVPVHDIGINADGFPFFTMKLIYGDNLMKILHKLEQRDSTYEADYPLSRLLTIFLKACDALAYAHSKDVIHLDLKPDNIQVSDYGEVLVVDWGLAKILHSPFETGHDFEEVIDSVDLTLNGFIKGTPGYMSPEQAMGRNQEKTKLTDIYCLGAILYSILTHKKPFDSDNLDKICAKTVKGELIPPRTRAPEQNIPQALEAVCLKAMAVKPEDRYQTADHLIADINAYTAGFSTSAEQASYYTELLLLMKRHKAISALIITGFIISFLFIIQLKKNETTILKTVQDLETEKDSRIKVSKLAAPRILDEAAGHIKDLDFKQALSSAALSAELDPDYGEAWLEKGRLHWGLQEFKNAAEAFKKCSLKTAEEYSQLLLKFGKRFSELTESETLKFITELHRLDSNDHISIQLFKYLNSREDAITRKISLVGKALEVLNVPGNEFSFECFFLDDQITLNLNNSWKISNIKPLAGLPVSHLTVIDTSIHDITILQTMPLETLNLSYAPVKDISSLRNMDIRELYIRGTRVNQLNPLRSLKNLERLEVDQNMSTILEVLLALDESDSIIVNDATAASLKHKYRSKLLQMREN